MVESVSNSNNFDESNKLYCWLEYKSDNSFPLVNLPFGVGINNGVTSCYSRIAEYGINLSVLEKENYLNGDHKFDGNTFNQTSLNKFMDLGKSVRLQVREKLYEYLHNKKYESDKVVIKSLEKLESVQMILPVQISDYTDFYSSKNHAFNVGSLFRPDNPLQPNWVHIPVGYHGRSSTVVVDGTKIRRPRGQLKKSKDIDEPIFSECKRLDYEVEIGVILGKSNEMGKPIKVNDASEYIFGYVILNDWSARDIQAWEYVPLGPFTAKNFATSISPWVITPEALEPFKITLSEQDPKPLKYLEEKERYSYDVDMTVSIKGKDDLNAFVIGETNYKYMYWTANQQISHHSVTGCSMKVGDLLGSGTISGTDEKSYGCLLEVNRNGTKKFKVGDKEKLWLEDHDTVVMTAICKNKDFCIGFGSVSGEILEALNEDEYY